MYILVILLAFDNDRLKDRRISMFAGFIDNIKYNGKRCPNKAQERVTLVIVILLITTPLPPIPGPFTVS